jgi:hypothetical protein
MPNLDDGQKGTLRDLTVELLLQIRSEYLAAGASPLKHWDQLQEQFRAASMRSADASEWVTNIIRWCRLGAPSKSRSLATDRLVSETDGKGITGAWLDMCERDYGLIFAMARS